MDPMEHIDFVLGPELQARMGILDRVDYGQIRRLGSRLRNVPRPGDDWDLPPATLQGWISSFEAANEVVAITAKTGLLAALQAQADEIRNEISQETIPQVDGQIAGADGIEALISLAKVQDNVKNFSLEQFKPPSSADLAHYLVVEIGVSIPWDQRPKVDQPTGLMRLKMGALLAQVVLGGAVAAANLALGVVGGIITSVPNMLGSHIPVTVGIIGSTYVGLNAVLKGVGDVSDELAKWHGQQAA